MHVRRLLNRGTMLDPTTDPTTDQGRPPRRYSVILGNVMKYAEYVEFETDDFDKVRDAVERLDGDDVIGVTASVLTECYPRVSMTAGPDGALVRLVTEIGHHLAAVNPIDPAPFENRRVVISNGQIDDTCSCYLVDHDAAAAATIEYLRTGTVPSTLPWAVYGYNHSVKDPPRFEYLPETGTTRPATWFL